MGRGARWGGEGVRWGGERGEDREVGWGEG